MSLSVSSQFPSNGSNQIHIPALSVDGLSTPVVLSPGPQKPWAPRPPEAALHRAQPRPMISSTPGGSEEKPDLHWLWNASLKTRRHEKFRLHRLTLFGLVSWFVWAFHWWTRSQPRISQTLRWFLHFPTGGNLRFVLLPPSCFFHSFVLKHYDSGVSREPDASLDLNPTRGHKRQLKATRRRRDVFLFFYWCFLNLSLDFFL